MMVNWAKVILRNKATRLFNSYCCSITTN